MSSSRLPTWVPIVIPFAAVTFLAAVGGVTYFILRRRKKARNGKNSPSDSEAENIAERGGGGGGGVVYFFLRRHKKARHGKNSPGGDSDAESITERGGVIYFLLRRLLRRKPRNIRNSPGDSDAQNIAERGGGGGGTSSWAPSVRGGRIRALGGGGGGGGGSRTSRATAGDSVDDLLMVGGGCGPATEGLTTRYAEDLNELGEPPPPYRVKRTRNLVEMRDVGNGLEAIGRDSSGDRPVEREVHPPAYDVVAGPSGVLPSPPAVHVR